MTPIATVESLVPKAAAKPAGIGAEVLALLSRAQLADSYQYLLNHLAGPLEQRIKRVFGGVYAPVYILTAPHRRQIWNAVIAARGAPGDFDKLRTELIETKSSTLLEQAYGSVPRGFTTVLKKCGEIALDRDFYQFWHRYLTDYPEDFDTVASQDSFSATLTQGLRDLPPELARLSIVERLPDTTELPRLVKTMTWIHRGRLDPALLRDLAVRLNAGEKPLTILTKIIDAVHCPPPYITDDDRFRHIGSVQDLKECSRKFQNCLGAAYLLKEAVRGNEQYYEYVDGEDQLIVGILADPPFGFILQEIRGPENIPPSDEQMERVKNALAKHGIVQRQSVFEIVEGWNGVKRDDLEDFLNFEM